MKRAAFYVWTQTQLVNAVIVRRAFFSDIPADLYVLDVGRISTNSLLFLKQRKIFDELVFFTLPPYCPTKLMLSKLPLLKLMIHSLEYKRFFSKLLLDKGPYNLFFAPGFWAETLYLLYGLSQKVFPSIYFIEEGLASYARSSFRCRIDSNWKNILEKYLCFGRFAVNANRAVIGIYLRNPEWYFSKEDIPCLRIPTIDNDLIQAEFLSLLRKNAPLKEYQNRNILFISTGIQPKYEPNHRESDIVLQQVIQKYGAENIIYKAHPTEYDEVERLQRLSSFGIYVDDKSYWFESIFPHIVWDNKTIVTRNSGSIFTLVCTSGFRPTLILTYRLYHSFQIHGDFIRERLNNIYAELYKENRGKLKVAMDLDEL